MKYIQLSGIWGLICAPGQRESIFFPSGSCRTADPHSGHLVPLCRFPFLLLIMPLLSSPINQVKTSTCHLLTHFLLAVQRGDRERERSEIAGALDSAPVQFWDYRIVSMYLYIYVSVCVLLFAFPFGVSTETTLIRSNGMRLAST